MFKLIVCNALCQSICFMSKPDLFLCTSSDFGLSVPLDTSKMPIFACMLLILLYSWVLVHLPRQAGVSWIELLILYFLRGGVPFILRNQTSEYKHSRPSLKMLINQFQHIARIVVCFFLHDCDNFYFIAPPVAQRRLACCGFSNHAAKLNFFISLKDGQGYKQLCECLLELRSPVPPRSMMNLAHDRSSWVKPCRQSLRQIFDHITNGNSHIDLLSLFLPPSPRGAGYPGFH
jgi:hypothetical protein